MEAATSSLTSVIVASVGLFASVITASLSFFLTKRLQFKMEERRIKEATYTEFMKAMSDVALAPEQDSGERFAHSFNALLLTANPDVVRHLMVFHEHVKFSNQKKRSNPEEWLTEHDRLLRELLIAMRADLFATRRKPANFPEIHLVGGPPRSSATAHNRR